MQFHDVGKEPTLFNARTLVAKDVVVVYLRDPTSFTTPGQESK